MNWVGGIRNRIRMQNDRKQQREFFERKKFSTTVRRSERSPPRTSSQHLSMDLLSLRTIHNVHTNRTPDKSNPDTERKIRHVDLREHKSHIKMIDNLDNRTSPVRQPSKIQIMDSKESLRLEKENDPSRHRMSQEERWAKQITPVQDTPVDQMFYTHGTRPPSGVPKVPPGLVSDIKRKYRKDEDQNSSTSFQKSSQFTRRDMMNIVTKEDLFPSPVLKKEKRVQITTTATWIPAYEERSFHPYSKPAPSSIMAEMRSLEKQESNRIVEEQNPSLWSRSIGSPEMDRFQPIEPKHASTAPTFLSPDEVPGASFRSQQRQQHNVRSENIPSHYDMMEDFRPRKRSNPFETEDFQVTPLRKYMSKVQPKEIKPRKRKHEDALERKTEYTVTNVMKANRSQQRVATLDDILDDAKFNKLQPRLYPSQCKSKDLERQQEEKLGNLPVQREQTKERQVQFHEEVEYHKKQIKQSTAKSRNKNQFMCPTDFKPLHESTPKNAYLVKDTQSHTNMISVEKPRYRNALTAMLFGQSKPEAMSEMSDVGSSKNEEPLAKREIPRTPDMAIPLEIRQRGCVTSPIKKPGLQTEWSQMIKPTGFPMTKNKVISTVQERVPKEQDVDTSSKKSCEKSTTPLETGYTIPQSPLDLTLKKDKPPARRSEVSCIADKSNSELLTVDTILDLTVGKVMKQQEHLLSPMPSHKGEICASTPIKNVITSCEQPSKTSTKDENSNIDKGMSLSQNMGYQEENVDKLDSGLNPEKLDQGTPINVQENTINIPGKRMTLNKLSMKAPISSKKTSTEEESDKDSDIISIAKSVETTSIGIQAVEVTTTKDAGSQCHTSKEEVKVSVPMASQFCQTESNVTDAEIQFTGIFNNVSVSVQTEIKAFQDRASSPISFDDTKTVQNASHSDPEVSFQGSEKGNHEKEPDIVCVLTDLVNKVELLHKTQNTRIIENNTVEDGSDTGAEMKYAPKERIDSLHTKDVKQLSEVTGAETFVAIDFSAILDADSPSLTFSSQPSTPQPQARQGSTIEDSDIDNSGAVHSDHWLGNKNISQEQVTSSTKDDVGESNCVETCESIESEVRNVSIAAEVQCMERCSDALVIPETQVPSLFYQPDSTNGLETESLSLNQGSRSPNTDSSNVVANDEASKLYPEISPKAFQLSLQSSQLNSIQVEESEQKLLIVKQTDEENYNNGCKETDEENDTAVEECKINVIQTENSDKTQELTQQLNYDQEPRKEDFNSEVTLTDTHSGDVASTDDRTPKIELSLKSGKSEDTEVEMSRPVTSNISGMSDGEELFDNNEVISQNGEAGVDCVQERSGESGANKKELITNLPAKIPLDLPRENTRTGEELATEVMGNECKNKDLNETLSPSLTAWNLCDDLVLVGEYVLKSGDETLGIKQKNDSGSTELKSTPNNRPLGKKVDVPYHGRQQQCLKECDLTFPNSTKSFGSIVKETQLRRSSRLRGNNLNSQKSESKESEQKQDQMPELKSPNSIKSSNIVESDLDSSKGYHSDWVSHTCNSRNRVKLSGKTYERIIKKEKMQKGNENVDSEYELVKMIAFQEDYEYITSSNQSSCVSSPVFKLEETVENSKQPADDSKSCENVCDEILDPATNEDKAKIRELSEEVVSGFEEELHQLDGCSSNTEKSNTPISRGNKESLTLQAKPAQKEDCDASKESITSIDEHYDTAEEY